MQIGRKGSSGLQPPPLEVQVAPCPCCFILVMAPLAPFVPTSPLMYFVHCFDQDTTTLLAVLPVCSTPRMPCNVVLLCWARLTTPSQGPRHYHLLPCTSPVLCVCAYACRLNNIPAQLADSLGSLHLLVLLYSRVTNNSTRQARPRKLHLWHGLGAELRNDEDQGQHVWGVSGSAECGSLVVRFGPSFVGWAGCLL